jgi:mRNA interferase YafQ
MRTAVTTSQFRRDYRLAMGRGLKIEKLDRVMLDLLEGHPLDSKFRDHLLRGAYRECHIAPDWLLIYKADADAVVFERTGSHADLFE